MKNPKEITLFVRDAMSRNVTWVSDEDSVMLVMQIFERTGISGAPVVSRDGKHVGVVTRTDLAGEKLIRLLREKKDLDATSITVVMNPTIKTVDEAAMIDTAAQMMLDNNFHRLFVTNSGGKIIGVLETLDILNALLHTTGTTATAAVSMQPDIATTARKLLRESQQSSGRH